MYTENVKKYYIFPQGNFSSSKFYKNMAFCGDETSSYDFEASIQISRILKILSDTIKNSEVVVSMKPN